MTINDLKSKLAREPFRPFVIELISGRRVPISEAGAVLLYWRRPELVIAFSDEGLQYEFETSAIASLIEA